MESNYLTPSRSRRVGIGMVTWCIFLFINFSEQAQTLKFIFQPPTCFLPLLQDK